jgi:ABC-type transport system substrate-binding protein
MRRFSIFAAVFVLACTLGCKKRQGEDGSEKSILRAALRQKVKSLDPAHAADYYSMVLVSRAYEGLLQYSYGKKPYVLEPALAASMPKVSDDGLTYRIQLKQNVLFMADRCLTSLQGKKGREMTADDVVYSWNRLLDTKTASPGKWTLNNRVASLKALSRYEVELKLKEAYPQILNVMAMPYLYIVPQECVAYYGDDFAMRPVGTGPFRLKSYSTKRFEWEKNPDYRKVIFPSGLGSDDEGKPLPLLDEIIDDVIEDDQTVWLAFLKGDHDYLMRVPAGRIHAGGVDDLAGSDAVFISEPSADFTYYAFNMNDPIVGGASRAAGNLRKAMALAFEAEPAIEKFYSGMAKRAQFLTVEGLLEHDNKYNSPWGHTFLAKAQEYLVKAGYPQGDGLPELTLVAPNDSFSRLQAEWFARCMEKINVPIKVQVHPWTEMMARINRREGHLYAVSWLYDYPDIENALQILVSDRGNGGPNKSNYSNPQYDKLYEQFRVMAPGAKRTAVVRKMREVFNEDVPWILGVHRYETRLLRPWVKNYRIHLFDFGIERYVRVQSRNNRMQAAPVIEGGGDP